MAIDTIADLLTRIRNAHMAGQRSVVVPVSKVSENILKVLKSEGFIESFDRKSAALGAFDGISVHLKYYKDGEPAISAIRRVSRSGLRIYKDKDSIGKVARGLGISIISTSQGIMSDREARSRKIGGEILAHVA